MSKIEAALEVLANESSEVADVVSTIGVGKLIKLAPAFYKIFSRIKKANADDPEEAIPMQYGTATFAEIKAFQRKHGLDDDGILGDKTWLKIKQLLGDKR